ncbi:hypothetical protein LUZ60_004320 [Juncus effusus]|nr:hypothetical protein LUZ60_004320 [Juncus effusus]
MNKRKVFIKRSFCLSSSAKSLTQLTRSQKVFYKYFPPRLAASPLDPRVAQPFLHVSSRPSFSYLQMDQQIAFKQLLSLSDSILFLLRSMKLHVYVLEASGLPPCESQSASVYAKLKIGKHNSRTKPVDSAVGVCCWNQEFVFRLSDDDTQSDFLQVSVFRQFEAAGKELLGRCRISMASLLEEKKRALPPTWFSLQPKHKNASKSKFNDHGKILLTISLVGLSKFVEPTNPQPNEEITPSLLDSVEKSTNSGQLNSDSLSRDTEESTDSLNKTQNSNTTNLISTFEEAMEIMKSRDESEFHENLQGGIILQKSYATKPNELNKIIFQPNSQFIKDLLSTQGSTDYEEGPWTWSTTDHSNLTRTVRYTKAASKLMKSVKGIEEQTYLKANGEKFMVLIRAETPDSTLMKNMIESNVNQGLKDNFEDFEKVLGRFVKPVCCDKEELLAPLRLEFNGLDLPDSFGELIMSGILILLIERVVNMISHFVQARLQRGRRDNEVRENGEGWLLTVALIEGINFPSINSGFLDPYVMLSCNGITKTSSVQLRTQDPQWNEIIEFDAMQQPPSVLDVEIFNFDGPFDSSISLGRAEINLIKHNSDELSDMWVPLEGKTNQESEPQLHLRIFLENSRGAETMKEYLNKMEKQVGKKFNIQSPHKNSTFQKLFGLPAEEYLIKDYSCSLKRKMPLQGRMFVSARVLGFYSNLLGHKTKFFFMWADVDEITELPPSFFTVGSPALQIILKPGRGLDARHGAKGQDGNGRLNFVFHSFMSFNTAARTIKALWRSKGRDETSISEEELESDEKPESLTDDTESISNSNLNTILNLDDVKLTKTFSIELSIPVDSLMEVFNGGNIETKIMSKVGCLDYSVTPWEAVKLKPSFLERQVSYKFNRYMSIFGSEVVSTQVKYPSTIGNGWIIDDVMTLHNVPFGDHFRIHLRYEMIRVQSDLAPISECDVFVGVEWLKSTKFKKKIVKNICVKLTQRSKEIFELAETELVCLKHAC